MKVRPLKLKCKQCGHEWMPRKKDVRKCPKCQSVYFDVPKSKENIGLKKTGVK